MVDNKPSIEFFFLWLNFSIGQYGENIRFTIVVHWKDDFLIMERSDRDFFCYMDLASQVHAGLSLDCEIRLQMKGEVSNPRTILVE